MSKRSIRSILKGIRHKSQLNIKEHKFIEKSLKDLEVVNYLINSLNEYEKPKDTSDI